MQGVFGKKKEGHKPELAPPKVQAPKQAVSPFDHAQIIAPQQKKAACAPLSPSMSEGPMLLKTVEESRKVEVSGRQAFEKSVKIELQSLRGRKKRKRKGKARAKRQKDGRQTPPSKD